MTPISRVAQGGGRTTRITLEHVWLTAALILIALRPLLTPIPPHDFWWHMATGRAILEQGQIPGIDSFSYTRAGESFYNQGWLAQILMYGLHQAGGIPLILIAQAFVILLAYGLLLRLCLIRTNRLRLSVALLLLTTLPLSFDNWNVRPQSYALPLFAGFLTILTEYRLGRNNRLWLLPVLMVLWANLHGTFVLGLALIGFTFLGEWLKSWRGGEPGDAPSGSWLATRGLPLIWWGLATSLATLVNPRGFGVIGYVRGLLSSSAVTTLVTEWSPPTIRDTGGQIFFLFLIACILGLAYARRRPDLTDMLLFGAFLWLALSAVRNIVWFGFVATLLLVVQVETLLAPSAARRPAGSSTLNGILIGVLGVLFVIGLPWFKPVLLPPPIGSLLMADTPVAAVAQLQRLPDRPQRLFHAMGYGSYMIWAAPEQKVFIDTRIELYPYDQWRDYINLGQANNVDLLLDRYGIDGLLLSLDEQVPLIKVVRADPRWVVRYEDEHSIYLTRR